MTSLLHDLRYTFRQLRKSPAFTGVAVLTLALGIGASTAMFSILSTALLRPLPYSQPGRIVMVWETKKELGNRLTVAAANFNDWKQRNHVFEQMALVGGATYNLTGRDVRMKVTALQVQAGLFNLLGSRPQQGSTFNPAEGKAGADNVVVLSDTLWKRIFGEQTLSGQTLTLDGRVYSIVGVMPADFELPVATFDLWVPLVPNAKQWSDREAHTYGVIARLRPNVSLGQAQREMDQISASLDREYPATNSSSGVRLVPIEEELVGNIRPALVAIFGAVMLLLLIACSNIAMLMLVRATLRRREIAIRLALGASKRKLLKPFFVESLLLASFGGALGLGISWLSIPLLRSLPINLTRLTQTSIDWRVLVFCAFAVILCTILFGFAPASQLVHGEPIASLNNARRSGAMEETATSEEPSGLLSRWK